MHAVTYGVTRDQMMARHKANHIQVAYANSARRGRPGDAGQGRDGGGAGDGRVDLRDAEGREGVGLTPATIPRAASYAACTTAQHEASREAFAMLASAHTAISASSGAACGRA